MASPKGRIKLLTPKIGTFLFTFHLVAQLMGFLISDLSVDHGFSHDFTHIRMIKNNNDVFS